MPERPTPEEFSNTPEIQQNTAEKSVEQRSFAEWCRLNGSLNPASFTSGKEENYDAAFQEGRTKLLTELTDAKNEELKLRDKLELNKLKSELSLLRQNGDITALGKREAEIARSFQEAVSEYPYANTCHITEILDKKEMNCVGASVLGGRLLDEVDIKYLVGHIGNHVLIVVVTADGKVLWQDMQDGKESPELANEELTAEKIEGATPEDIVNYHSRQQKDGITFLVKKEGYWQNKPMTLLAADVGLELQELISTGFILGNQGRCEEAIEVLNLAAKKAPGDSDVYLGLARAYKGLKGYKEAIEACQKALDITPDDFLKDFMDELRSSAGIK